MNIQTFTVQPQRTGSVLLLVLVVVMLLSFSAYSFVELMLVELEATHVAVSQTQLRRLADSGITSVCASHPLSEIGRENSSIGLNLKIAQTDFTVSSYSIVPNLGEINQNRMTSGIINESNKLNINSLPLDSFARDAARNRLLNIPEMSQDIADAILDWMDEDNDPSQFGAESSYYQTLKPGYSPRQARISSLSELLRVRGVTSELLFGKDGRSGWSQYLTVDSREANVTSQGTPKINLNTSDLDRLFTNVEEKLGIEAAKFIVGWRLAGNANGSEGQRVAPDEVDSVEREARIKERRIATAQERLKHQLGRGRSQRSRSANGNENDRTSEKIRGGIDIGRPAAYAIRSIYDLIGTTVRISVNQKDTVLQSPWSLENEDLVHLTAELESQFAVSDESAQLGRININQAAFEVLLTVPGIDESLAEEIMHIRQGALQSRDAARMQRSVYWLVEENVIDIKKLRLIAPFITTGGDVFSGVSIGHNSDRPVGFAVGFTVDCAPHSRQILRLQDFGPIPWNFKSEESFHE